MFCRFLVVSFYVTFIRVFPDVLYSWSPKDLGKAKAIMQYNLATAHAIRGEYEKSLLHLEKVRISVDILPPV